MVGETEVALIVVVEECLLEILAKRLQLVEVFAVCFVECVVRSHNLALVRIFLVRHFDLLGLVKLLRRANK